MKSKLLKLSIFVFFCALFVTFGWQGKRVSANSGGPDRSRTGAPGELTCATTACHLGTPVNSGGGTLTISGFPAEYSPNQEVDITVTMSQAGRVRFGFQATIIDDQGRAAGTVTATDPSRTFVTPGQVGNNLRQYIQHNLNGTSPNGGANQGRWIFRWKAPAQSVGRIRIFVASNAANNNGAADGDDLIYTANASAQLATQQPNPVPTVTNLSPSSATAGNGDLSLTVSGSNFVATSQVLWNGNARATNFVSATQLTAAIPAGDLATAGMATITVMNPTPGGGSSNTQTFTILNRVATVSAASFAQNVALAPETIVSGFGTNLSVNVVIADTTPLPTELDGTQIVVRDSNNVDRNASLFFVAPTQINYLIPAGTAVGAATISVRRGGNTVGQGTVQIDTVSPGIFTANASGQGVPAATALRVIQGQLVYDSIYTSQNGQVTPIPIDLDLQGGTDVYLILYGTGVKGAAAGSVTATIGGTPTPILGFAAAPGFVGLDQINVGPIPRSLIGRGNADVALTVNGKPANTVTINIK